MRLSITVAVAVVASGLPAERGRAQMPHSARPAPEPMAPVLNATAHLQVTNVPRLQALTSLSESSGVGLAFSSTLLSNANQDVSCDCEYLTVREALDRLLADAPVNYRVLDGQIVVTPLPIVLSALREWPRPSVMLANAIEFPVQPSMPPGMLSLPPDLRLLQQQPGITGTVVDSVSNQPLAGAQVTVEGTGRRFTSDAQGVFRVDGLTGREVTLRVVRLGYRPLIQTVRVGAPDIRLALARVAIGLDEIVVTATGEQRLIEVGSAIARVRADSAILTAPVTDFAELLAARAAGVFVKTASGSSVGGSRIRIRGASSPSLPNEPLVYIDGIRVNTDPQSLSFATNQQVPSRLNDINPSEIESIDVIKGPSASTMYGTEAANGVILITTKSGAAATRKADWRVWSEGGRITEPNEYPPNYGAVTATGAACPLTSQAAGLCQQAELRTFNLLEDPGTTVFRTGWRGVLGASVGGTATDVNYFVSGEYESEDGIYRPLDGVRKAYLRANFGARPSEKLQIQVSTGYVSSNLKLFADGGTALGLVTTGLAGQARSDGWFQFTPQQIYQIDSRQHVDRFIGSSTLRFQPARWVQLRGVVGLDAIGREDQRLFPVGVFPGVRADGIRDIGRNTSLRYSTEFLARFDVPLTAAITSRSSLGSQFFRDRATEVISTGSQLVPGTNSLGAAALTTTREFTTEVRSVGVFFEQQFGYHDRLFVTGGLRSDNNSSFGREFNLIVYPKLGASWAISDEPFFPRLGPVSSLRLRAAWGQSGSQPGSVDAVQFYAAYPATVADGSNRIGVSFEGGSLGNPLLKAERSSEIELGFDGDLWNKRIDFSFTYYDKRTKDALVFRQLAPSVGASSGRWENLAETQNQGYEGSLAAGLMEGRNVRLRLSSSFAYNKNKLLSLGVGVAPISLGNNQRHVEGYPLGGYWMRSIQSFADANGDGIIAGGEITPTDTAIYLGEVIPPFMASIEPSLDLFNRLRIGGVLSLSYGHKLYNFTEGFRCNGAGARGRNEVTTPLDEQARCVAHALLGVPGGYAQDAGFTKLRELSLTLYLPPSWASLARVREGSITLAGQNLGTWTKYPGIDPDISSRGTNFAMVDFFQPGSRRMWMLRVNLNF